MPEDNKNIELPRNKIAFYKFYKFLKDAGLSIPQKKEGSSVITSEEFKGLITSVGARGNFLHLLALYGTSEVVTWYKDVLDQHPELKTFHRQALVAVESNDETPLHSLAKTFATGEDKASLIKAFLTLYHDHKEALHKVLAADDTFQPTLHVILRHIGHDQLCLLLTLLFEQKIFTPKQFLTWMNQTGISGTGWNLINCDERLKKAVRDHIDANISEYIYLLDKRQLDCLYPEKIRNNHVHKAAINTRYETCFELKWWHFIHLIGLYMGFAKQKQGNKKIESLLASAQPQLSSAIVPLVKANNNNNILAIKKELLGIKPRAVFNLFSNAIESFLFPQQQFLLLMIDYFRLQPPKAAKLKLLPAAKKSALAYVKSNQPLAVVKVAPKVPSSLNLVQLLIHFFETKAALHLLGQLHATPKGQRSNWAQNNNGIFAASFRGCKLEAKEEQSSGTFPVVVPVRAIEA